MLQVAMAMHYLHQKLHTPIDCGVVKTMHQKRSILRIVIQTLVTHKTVELLGCMLVVLNLYMFLAAVYAW